MNLNFPPSSPLRSPETVEVFGERELSLHIVLSLLEAALEPGLGGIMVAAIK
jgi:hypothetical protein